MSDPFTVYNAFFGYSDLFNSDTCYSGPLGVFSSSQPLLFIGSAIAVIAILVIVLNIVWLRK